MIKGNSFMTKRNVWGIIAIGLVMFMTLLGYFYTPYDPSQTAVLSRLQPPSLQHPFGTDHFGRDIFSRVLVGGRVSLFCGLASVSMGAAVGVFLGLWSGFHGGFWDEVSMRLSDGLQALPAILLALLLATVWQPGVAVILWSVAIGNVPIFLRLTRTQTLKIKAQPYLEASRALGASDFRMMFCHTLPNLKDALLVQFSLSLAGAILVEASLSYLGVGIQPPQPSWGRMLRDAQSFASLAPWAVLIPGFFIALTIIGFNLLGDSWIHRRYR